jgi:hypothetical protein
MLTEAEWLSCAEATKLLLFVRQHRGMRRETKQRKQRLFSVACCRRIWPLIENEGSRGSIEVVERFADDQATSEELQAAEAEASAGWLKNAADDALFACVQVCYKKNDGLHVSTTTISAVFKEQHRGVKEPREPLAGRMPGACPSEDLEQCKLLRCIFGNPFRRVAFSAKWLTTTVRTLAQQMYESRDFSAMPILGDALQDAGCANDDILSHCLGAGPHVRGCWVVDHALAKA